MLKKVFVVCKICCDHYIPSYLDDFKEIRDFSKQALIDALIPLFSRNKNIAHLNEEARETIMWCLENNIFLDAESYSEKDYEQLVINPDNSFQERLVVVKGVEEEGRILIDIQELLNKIKA